MRIAGVCLMFGATMLVGCSGGGDDPTPPVTAVFTTLTVEPSSIPTLTVGGTQQLTATAKDQNGAAMSGLTTTYISSAPTTASVSPAGGLVTGQALGTATITATGTIGSVSKTATVNVTVGAPPATVSVAATSGNQFNPANAVVARNGTVTWTFAIQHNVTFDTPNSPANIGNTDTGSVSRTFPTAGTFAYHCTIHGGMSGSVQVVGP